MKAYYISKKIRGELKQPLGDLVVGNPEKTMSHLKRIIALEKPTKLISIGDCVTLNMIKYGISANLYVIDNKIMRKPIEPIHLEGIKTIRVTNPPGTITLEAIEGIRKGIDNTSVTRIVVDGEEDLLTLLAIKFAPRGTVIVYGQPHIGIVIVKVTDAKRMEVEQILQECAV